MDRLSIMSVRVAGGEGSTAAHRTQIAKAKTQNPESKQSPTNTSGLPFTPTSEPRIQNPESGIQTPAALMNPRAWRDIRTQNPESGIRKPDPSLQNLCERPRDIRTQNPESGIRNPDRSSPHEHVCMAVQPQAFKGHQNPEPRSQKPEPSEPAKTQV